MGQSLLSLFEPGADLCLRPADPFIFKVSRNGFQNQEGNAKFGIVLLLNLLSRTQCATDSNDDVVKITSNY